MITQYLIMYLIRMFHNNVNYAVIFGYIDCVTFTVVTLTVLRLQWLY